MSQRTPVEFNTGVGRFIGGSLYEGSTTDSKGQPRVYKTGPKKGQPRTDYSVGIALAKVPGQHWATSPWGAVIWAEGHAAWPSGQAQRPDFAWKIIDGDSTIPNKSQKRPCDQTDYPGHWILWFGGTTPAPLAVAMSGPPVWNNEPNFCMPGDFIEVKGSVVGNDAESPGVYLNANAVCMRGYHQDGRITSTRVDLATAGFGSTPLPAGASMVPTGSAMAPPPAPGAPAATSPTASAPPAPGAAAPSPSVASPPVPVTPNAAILGAPAPANVPAAPVASPAVPAAPAPAVHQMTAKAAGATYESFIGNGWTDAAMVAEGYMLP